LNNTYTYHPKDKTPGWSVLSHGCTIYASAVGFGQLDDHNVVDDIKTDKHNKVFGKDMFREMTSEKWNTDNVRKLEQVTSSLMTLNDMPIIDDSDQYIESSTKSGQHFILTGSGTVTSPINGDVVEEFVAPQVMDYWDDETAMVPGKINLPRNNIGLVRNSEFEGIKKVSKSKMVPYPTHSQPAYVKRMNAGTQAVSELFGDKLVLRQVEHDPKDDAKKFAETYFKKNSANNLPEVNIDYNEVAKWIRDRPDGLKILDDLEEVVSSGLDLNAMDKVNVHMKLESRMKDAMMYTYDNKMPETIEEQRIRLIVWQRKGITSIFAPFFQQIKDNLKKVLIDNVVYADGLTPQQLSAIFNQHSADVKNNLFAEDDLKKQDRQTDKTLIATEMEIYKKLGGNARIIKMWQRVHENWRAKGIGLKFKGDASRHTGQATTALGNVVVNLIVKERLVRTLGKRLVIMVVLGDDNLIIARKPITKNMIELNSARHFNMKSEAETSPDCGTFLRMIVYVNSNGQYECGPDFVRLRRRYQVLNGVADASSENVKMRAMSYCCMIGKLPVIEQLVNKRQFDIQLDMWYEYGSLSRALAIKYKTSTASIDGCVNHLAQMMSSDETFLDEKLMFTERGT